MHSEEAHGQRGPGSHVPDLMYNSLDQHELDTYWPDFELKILDLFITADTDCEVELVEFLSSAASSPPEQATVRGSGNEGGTQKRVITAGELERVLHVCSSRITDRAVLTILQRKLPHSSLRILCVFREKEVRSKTDMIAVGSCIV